MKQTKLHENKPWDFATFLKVKRNEYYNRKKAVKMKKGENH